MKTYWVYILASRKKGALYIGVTSNIGKRVWEHKEKFVKGHTNTYNIDKLVYTEEFDEADAAHAREKTLKKWHRSWKIELIENINPEWDDLYEKIN